MKTVIIAYIPVIHRGYLNFFNKYPQCPIFVVDPTLFPLLAKYPYERDLRALPPELIVSSLQAIFFGKAVVLLNELILRDLVKEFDEIILPDEEISRLLVDELPMEKITFANVFLRWDRTIAGKAFNVDVEVVTITDESLAKMLLLASEEAKKSSDWWRHVGCVAVTKDNDRLYGHNHHLPSEQSPNIDAEPRSDFNAGEHIDLSSAIHAEASLIARAAKEGISLDGATLFVTTFPCPVCAKSIAESGISEVYFEEGYSLVGAKEVLESKGVKLIKVIVK